MSEILNSYKVNTSTKLVSPAYQIDYQSIVLEGKNEYLVKKTPLEIIKEATIQGGSEYKGRRTSMTYLTGIHKKIPIPISESKDIYAFPTCSPNNPDCIWVFVHHVEDIMPSKGAHPSIILFNDGVEKHMKESQHILKKQLYRTWLCKKALQRKK
ncbi:competence protein ComK [Bacillus sp. B1-b2]|uniref:competence protein ComK n=1 Tax=Bacillus sp. B1-b2 TaxID=2653201 RepID=UPI001262048B|nr:competence protein ComK [Bacillus sp. B1-b2]KAB7662872.1 competence protein [Bacillus sp. B1-b2]